MTPITTVNNTIIPATTTSSQVAVTSTAVKNPTTPAPNITTSNSSTVKVSAAALIVAKAVTATPAPMTVVAVLASGANIPSGTVIKDTAANIQSNLKALAALTPAANITGITLSDTAKASISVARADVKGDLSAVTNTDTVAVFLRKITTAYNLTVTGLTASDALTLKAPASSATLAMSVTDTAANLVTNLDALQAKVKTKSITAFNIAADPAAAAKPLISITTMQLTADIDALNVLKGNFDLTVTGVAAVDAASTAGKADAILKAAASLSTMSKIAVSDTSANISTNITKIELAGAAGRIMSITVSDSKALVLTEAQILASTNTLNAQYTAPVKVEATAVAAADTSKVQTAVNSHTSLSLTKETISDTAANIAAKLDDLEKLAVPSSASGSFTLASIGVSDKGSITVSNSTLLKDLDALKIVTGVYTLKLTNLAVADAIKITPPSKDATLSLTVSDTVSNVTANFDKLQTLAKAKSVSGITMTDASSAALKITSAQYKAGTEALGVLQGTYYLGITGVAIADMATSLKAKNIYSLDIVDTSANVIKNLAALQAAVSSAKIQSVTLTDTASFTLSISDAYNLMTSLPNLTLGKNVKINIADTASNIVAHTRDDIGDVLKNAGTVTLSDKTPPNLTLADAITLKGIANLDKTTKYNVTDGGAVIAAQAALAGEAVLSGAASVSINKNFTIADAKAIMGIKTLAKGTVYSISDTADNILAQAAVLGDKILSAANTVTVVDTSARIIARLDQLEVLAKLGKIADIKFTDTPEAAAISTATNTFSALPSGTPITKSGLTFTPNKALTAAEVAAAFANLASGATTGPSTANGTYSGALATGVSTGAVVNTRDVVFTTAGAPTPSAALNITQNQLINDAEAIGKIVSQPSLIKFNLPIPNTPSPLTQQPTIIGPTGITTNSRPTLSGVSTPNSIVKIYDNISKSVIFNVKTGSDGSWSYKPSIPLNNITYSLIAQSLDNNGNILSSQKGIDFTINAIPKPDLTNAQHFNEATGTIVTTDEVNLPSGNQSRTYATWVKVDVNPKSYNSILMYQGEIAYYGKCEFMLDFGDQNCIGLDFQVGAVYTDPTNVNDGNSHFVAATFDKDNGVSIYLDGVKLNVKPWNNGFNSSQVNTAAGATAFGGERNFYNPNNSANMNGTLGNSQIYNNVLTPDQIKELYYTGTTSVQPVTSKFPINYL